MEIIDASKPDEFYDGGDLSWIDFQGAWGNIQTIVSSFCLFKILSILTVFTYNCKCKTLMSIIMSIFLNIYIIAL